jgi:hypothetical protein
LIPKFLRLGQQFPQIIDALAATTKLERQGTSILDMQSGKRRKQNTRAAQKTFGVLKHMHHSPGLLRHTNADSNTSPVSRGHRDELAITVQEGQWSPQSSFSRPRKVWIAFMSSRL